MRPASASAWVCNRGAGGLASVFWAIRQLTVLGIIKLISARGDECRLSALHGERHLNEQHDGG
jgi:hypothetical protein